ncbi:MAG TPA: fumarate hydratase [Firmicutes bacterium]|jgi:fumarate hydratase subunit alpha|nr:fumarate hydratase [Bacillota bacterium]
MREISKEVVIDTVCQLFLSANVNLPNDVREALVKARDQEIDANARKMLSIIVENYKLAEKKQTPICQDTGMAVVFVEWGSEVVLQNSSLEEAINEGVKKAYETGYFRKSVVKDPLKRENTGDNTPAVIHTKIVGGDRVKITVAPKGFGSENMSSLKMFNPTASWDEIEEFVVNVVKNAGAKPCPPVVVGVGIGGTTEKATLLAKEALLSDLSFVNPDPFWATKESSLLKAINKTGIGPQGIGGLTTALSCHIRTFPTHIAGMPVAVNLNCHASRHKEAYL